MFKKSNHLKKYSYLNLTLIFFIASLIGILIEYLINGDFIGSGLYTTLFLMIAYCIKLWLKQNKK